MRRVKGAVAEFPNVSVQVFSSLSRLGTEEATAKIESWLVAEAQIQKSLGQGGAEAETASQGTRQPAQGGEAGDGNSTSPATEIASPE